MPDQKQKNNSMKAKTETMPPFNTWLKKPFNDIWFIFPLKKGFCQCDPEITGNRKNLTKIKSNWFKFYLSRNQCPICKKKNPRCLEDLTA